ncbi:hypothetical protein ZIOFF_008459 [Zingiber officinale]|uniref:Uncharacterized protein n=1 Tax=Zingiber officinale TaxID=94328 RepID=A0A8J5IGA8_ZINOF|nr:hypothetical protein ZIOFF_008459 [Zingiber officinale]
MIALCGSKGVVQRERGHPMGIVLEESKVKNKSLLRLRNAADCLRGKSASKFFIKSNFFSIRAILPSSFSSPKASRRALPPRDGLPRRTDPPSLASLAATVSLAAPVRPSVSATVSHAAPVCPSVAATKLGFLIMLFALSYLLSLLAAPSLTVTLSLVALSLLSCRDEVRLSQIVDAVSLAKATMARVYQNLASAVAYNVVAIPIAVGILLPKYDFVMTPSLFGD